jgi:uncharacterized protein YegL
MATATTKPNIKIIDTIKAVTGEEIDGRNFSFMPKDAFFYDNNYWVSVQTESWQSDEANWDNLQDGTWGGRGVIKRAGGALIMSVPENLSLVGAEYLRVGADDIAIKSAGNSRLSFSVTNMEDTGNGTLFYEVVNTNTGSILASGNIAKTDDTTTVLTPLINFTEGSYIARVKLHAEQPYRLPAGYVRNVAYEYEEDGVKYIYDPEYNIGRLPSQDDHPLILLRADILERGVQKDKPQWIRYLSGFGSSDGEWSALKVVITNSSSSSSNIWTFNSDILSSVGPVLIRKAPDNLNERIVVNFDPLARSITESRYVVKDITDSQGNIVIPKDTMLLAGKRASRTGAHLALWLLSVGDSSYDIQLLATDPDPATYGEGGLLDHSASTIVITEDGKLFILTRAALHRFMPDIADITQKLPGTPSTNFGFPGGQSLGAIGDKLYFLSQFVGSTSLFTNFLVSQVGNERRAGDGSVFHGPNAGAVWLNKYWSIYQDKPFSDRTAKQYLAFFDGLTWAKKTEDGEIIIDSGISFDAEDYNWQRVVNSNNVLHLFGKRGKGRLAEGEEDTGSIPNIDEFEDGVMGISDGSTFKTLDFNYRVLKASNSYVSPTEDKLILIAYKVDKPAIGASEVDTDVFYVLEVNYEGEIFDFEFNKFDECFQSNLIVLPEKDPRIRPPTCGPMDVVFIIDDTGSMGGAINNVRKELLNIFQEIENVSDNNYRISIVTFKDDVTVVVPFGDLLNKDQVTAAVNVMRASGGGDWPEASDEALNTVVNELAERTNQNGDFTPFRDDVIKIIILVTDAPSGGFPGANDNAARLHLIEVAEDAAVRDMLISGVYVPTGSQGDAAADLKEIADITNGAYVMTAPDGSGTGKALKDIIAKCGGRSSPLNAVSIGAFYPYMWWEDGRWVGHQTLPLDSEVCYISRGVVTDTSSTFGYVRYCGESRVRFPKDNDAFVWVPDYSAYVMLSEDLNRVHRKDESELPNYLNWDSVNEVFNPSDTIDSTAYLELSSSEGIMVYSPAGTTSLPDPTDQAYEAIEYFGLRPWKPGRKPAPVLVYSTKDETFSIDVELLRHRYGLVPADLPEQLIANVDTGKWESYSSSSSSSSSNDAIITKSVVSDKVVYTLCSGCTYPYHPYEWYSRGIQIEDGVGSVVSIKAPVLVWDNSELAFSIDSDYLIKNYNLSFNDLPVYLEWFNELWLPIGDITDSDVYLALEETSGKILYRKAAGVPMPYTVNSLELKGIEIGEGKFIFTTGAVYDDEVTYMRSPWNIKGFSKPLFIYDKSDDTIKSNKFNLLYDSNLGYSDLPDYLTFSTGYWSKSNTQPVVGLYLSKSETGSYIEFSPVEAQGGTIEWPYDISNWSNRAIELNGLIWRVTPINAPKLTWDQVSEAFTVDTGYLKDSFGITDLSYLPDFLEWDSDTEYWAASDQGSGAYLVKTVEQDRLVYTAVNSLPTGYNISAYISITMDESGNWTPSTIDAPTLIYVGEDCFSVDLEELIYLYGVTNTSSLPEYLVWDEECFVEGTPNESSYYLARFETATEIRYCAPNGLPYDPEDFPNPGNALSLGWDRKACPIDVCPPYNFNNCSVTRVIGNIVVRGNIVDGDFIPCDCTNAYDCMEGMPDGTKWKRLKLYRHGLPINIVELVDPTEDYILFRYDKRYSLAWYRTVPSPEYSEEGEVDFLRSFNSRIRYDRITTLNRPVEDILDVVILVIPKVKKLKKLPPIIRLA